MAEQSADTFFTMFMPRLALRSLRQALSPSAMPVAQWEVEVGVGGALCRIEGDAHAVADLAGADRLPARTRDLVLFKVVIRDLGKPVRPNVSGQDKLSGVQAICTHRMLRLDPATETCIASTTPALTNSEFEPVTLQLSSLPTEALKSIRTWKQSSDLAVHMAAHISLPSGMDPDTAAEVVRVLAQTTSGTLMAAFDGDADQRAVIDFFLKDGMIQGPPFTFTMKGMENIEVSVNLTADTLVANMKLEDIADQEKAELELLGKIVKRFGKVDRVQFGNADFLASFKRGPSPPRG